MARKTKTKKTPARISSDASDESKLDSSPTGTTPASAPLHLRLKLLVFTAGAVLMGLEIAGSRVLAPHFGNSVFVWGSLISVFLMALSVGYYLGGLLADRFPSRVLLNSICAAVAMSMFGIAFFAHGICAALVEGGFGEQSGPFAASMLLFLAPSVGMGMVSPFAVRLATHSVARVGHSAGTLYALSTLGSIVGTLLTTFVLIPQFGLIAILKGLALALLAVAVATMPFTRRPDALTAIAVLIAAGAALAMQPGPDRTFRRLGDELLVDVDTPYHHISVVDYGDVREMRFDKYVESAIYTKPPYQSLADYTDYFHLAFLLKEDIDRAVFIGAGGGIGPRTFHTHDPDMKIDVVDIDPKVLEVAKSHFFFDDSLEGIRSIAKDGRMFLRKTEHEYDCVVLDAFTIGGRIPFHLVTKEFFALCHERMTEDGVFVMNINSAIEGPHGEIYQSMQRTLDEVFPQTHVFAKGHRQRGTAESMNVIFVASKSEQALSAEDWQARAEEYSSRSYVDQRTMERMAGDLLVELPDASEAPLFTDDYAPIETMAF